MDASLPGGVSSKEVPLQVETSVVSDCTEVASLPWKQATLGVLEVQTTGVPKNTEKVERINTDGSSNVLINLSKDSVTEESRLPMPVMLGRNEVPKLQQLDTSDNVPRNGEAGLIKENILEENVASKEKKNLDSNFDVRRVVAKEISQVRIESQLPMRQLARKGGMLKAEAEVANAPSIADAVKEGILKKEKDLDKKEALAAVMAVHGRRKEAAGRVAVFPGVTGPENGRLCQCCSRPENLKATILCDKCERGYHIECLKIWAKVASEMDVWHCGPCGVQPGHYWPLGRVLISYKDAVAEYQKYSKFLPTDKRNDLHVESTFDTYPLEIVDRGLDKHGVQGIAYKVKDIRDFKKEARKGANKGTVAAPGPTVGSNIEKLQAHISTDQGSVAGSLGQPVGFKAEALEPQKSADKGMVAGISSQPVGVKADALPAVHMHLYDAGIPAVTKHDHFASNQTQGGISQQPKMYLYPGYVPIQPRPLLTSTAPLVNFNVPPESTVVRSLTSPTAPVLISHQPKTILPYTKYTVNDAPVLNYPVSISTPATPTKVTYMTTYDTSTVKASSSGPDPVLGTSQSQKGPVVGIPDSNVLSSSNLTPASKESTVHPKWPGSGTTNLEVRSTEVLRPFVPGEPLTEREELLRDAKESLNQLRTFITAIRGDLGEGWEVVLRRRPTGALEKFFLSPAKRKYRSRLDVGRYLGLVDDPRCQKIKPGDFGTSLDKYLEKTVISPHPEQATEVTNLPMFCGDVMIEKLGIVDSRPTYSDENQIWPVGFRSSWHDSETGSYCISEVGDGGDSGPIFRVTRKLVIGPANINNHPLASRASEKAAHISEGSPFDGDNAKSRVEEKISVSCTRRPEELELQNGDTSGLNLPTECSNITENLNSKDIGEEINKHHAKVEGQNMPSSDGKGVSVIEGLENGGKNLHGEAVCDTVKEQIVINHAVGQAVIDLTESPEDNDHPVEVRPRDIMDARYSFLDIKRDHKATTNGKGESHRSELPPNVIDLSDGEDEKLPEPPQSRNILDSKYSFLDVSKLDKNGGDSSSKGSVFHDKYRGQNKEGVTAVIQGNCEGVLPPHIRPLPNILMEELSVDGRTSTEAWRLFGKKFVENCKLSLKSGVNCTVPIVEATNDYVIFNSTTPKSGVGAIENANSEVVVEKRIDRSESTKALQYARLEKKLGEDRFGLNLPEVQRMIKALQVRRLPEPVKEVEQIAKLVIAAPLPVPPVTETAASSALSSRRRKRKNKAPTETDISGDETGKRIKLSPTELVVSHQASVTIVEQQEAENMIYHHEFVPGVIIPPPAPVPPPFIFVEEPRLPPPDGQPILKQLPSELVGDLLQVWEFLFRFSDLLGLESHLTLEDLESGLVDMGPVGLEQKNSSGVQEGKKQSENEEAGTALISSDQGQTTGPNEEKSVKELDGSGDKDLSEDNRVSSKLISADDCIQDNLDVDKLEKGKSLTSKEPTQTKPTSPMNVGVEGEKQENAPEDLNCQGNYRKDLQASEEDARGTDTAIAFPDGTVSQSLSVLAGAHIPLLKFLVADLKFRVAGSQNEGETDEPRKRGRRRICDIGPLPPEFGDDLPMNEITWPELAHRYLTAVSDVRKQGEIAELAPEERKKLVRFFEGDGGVMGGAVEGIVGVESDAQVLAEAEKELSIRMPKPVEKDIVIFVPQEWDVALTPINPAPKKTKGGKAGERPEVLPKWVEALEPVRKMPTNLGTKIKNQVQESLDCKPPEWAKATLDWSLSKGTFKSNAAGTTKRAVLEVLAQYHGEELKAINAPRVRKVKSAPSAEHLMQRCRIVLREVAKADSKQVFSNLVGGAYAVKSSKVTETVARPLDFRNIDARLAAGAYGGSTEAFAADMRQIWRNVEGVHKAGSSILELANNLSQFFEKLYLKQVISLIKGVSETKEREKEKAVIPDGDNKSNGTGRKTSTAGGTELPGKDGDGKLGKAPWEDDTTCRVCGIDEDYDSILLCDGCDAEYHIYCLVPPLERVPEGNWFCPACVAVEEGFPEAPPLGEAEVAALQEEMERPVVGSILRLEFEDEKTPSGDGPEEKAELEKGGRNLRSGTKPGLDVEEESSPQQPLVVESTLQALLSRMEEKEYWQLTLADRLFLLKFLCDEALKTPQVRAHLEKSVDVALELQQQLRDLVAERLKIVVPMDVTNQAKSTNVDIGQKLETPGLQTGKSTEGYEMKGGPEAGSQAARPRSHTSEVAGVPGLLPVSKVDAVSVLSGVETPGKMNEGSSELGGKIVHDLDLNVVAVREPDLDTSIQGQKFLGGVAVQDTKKRSFSSTEPVDQSSRETEQLPSQELEGITNKRLKLENIAGEVTEGPGGVEVSQPTKCAKVGPHIVGNETGSGFPSVDENSSAQKKETNQMQPCHSGQSKLTSTSEIGVINVLVFDSTTLPANALKRSLEIETKGLPSATDDGLENGKKAIREDESLVKDTVPGIEETKTNDALKIPLGAAADVKALEEEKDRISALQSAKELDEKITRLGLKLFNSSLRREHMGTDCLGREYWALTGADQRPWLVVAEMIAVQNDEACEGTLSDSGIQNHGLRGIGECSTLPPGTDRQDPGASVAGLQSAAPDLKSVDEGIRWLSYKGDQALDELVKWLSPRSQQERALRVAIYHWRRSVYPRHLLDMPEALNQPSVPQLDTPIINESSKDNGDMEDSSLKRKENTRKAQRFPSMKATNVLQKRYAASRASGSGDETGHENQKNTSPHRSTDVRRCECLEPLWTSRLHCQTCHETYEATAEFQLHLSNCPPGSRPSPENQDKEVQCPIPSKSRKFSIDGNKSGVKMKSLTSIEKDQDLIQRSVKAGSTRSERAKRGLRRGGSQPTVGDDTNMESGEALELLSDYAESLQAKKSSPSEVKEPIEDDIPSNGFLKALEELIEPSSQTSYPQILEQHIDGSVQESREEMGSNAATFAADEWGTNSWPEKFDVRRGKQVSNANQFHNSQGHCSQLNSLDNPPGDQGNRGGWVNDLNNSHQSFTEDDASQFGYNPTTPMMFSTPDSTRERVNQIGFSDQGPTFAPGLHNSPAFDPTLMISSSPDFPCMEGFPSLDQSNPTSLPYQQFLPPHDNLNHTPAASHTNFLLSLNDTNSRPVPYNQYLPSSFDNPNPGITYQQFLPPPDSLSITPSPFSNVLPNLGYVKPAPAPAPAPYTNFLQSLDASNPQTPIFSSQYLPSLEHTSQNTNSNPSASLYANLNANANTSVPHYTNLNTNTIPSLYTNLNTNSNPSASAYPHFPPNTMFTEPEPKRFDLGRFNSNSWFDAQHLVEPMTIERPAVIPTKPTARRTSTWDYLTNLPLPPSNVNERFVQKHHMEATGGHGVTPTPPIEVGSLPFDLMFEKPQREDPNLSTVSEDVGTSTLDLMLENQQIEGPSNNSVVNAPPVQADSVTLDLMFEKQEQEQEVFQGSVVTGTAAPVEIAAFSIDLMSVPEEQTEIVAEAEVVADATEAEAEAEIVVDATAAAKETSPHILQEIEADRLDAEQVEVGKVSTSEQIKVAPPPLAVGGKKPVKRFPVVDASVRPMVGEQKYLLKGLQISLLDMEAAMTSDVLESSRASPIRRRAWRSLVKSAACIYELTKATILLELMVKAEYLKPNWGYWCSLSAAARTSSLSSLALRLFSLDSAITYERVKSPGEGKELANSNKNLKKKKKKPLEVSSKKKKLAAN